jgi:glycosyltransferase involved in cell wall biosynthesis
MAEPGRARSIRKIALVGNSPPRLCGIATFTAALRDALQMASDEIEIEIYAMDEAESDHRYGPDVVCRIRQDEPADYRLAARRINASGADIVLLQHEYGIFGGPAGSLVLDLLDRVEAPAVTTLHTVLEKPDADQRRVIEAILRRSSQVIVMARKGRDIIERVHGVSPTQVRVIWHGVPDRPPIDPAMAKPRFGFEGRNVMLTFGLLSPNKGIETMIAALPRIVAGHPGALYVVLGATHPNLVQREGEAYRERLGRLAAELGVAENLKFIDGFLEQDLLLDYLEACDIYVTPYLNEAQITSGTLSYAVGLGKPVISTPYWHAAELLADGIGILAGFGDSDAFAEAVIGLFDDPGRMAAMRERAWEIGRSMTWTRIGGRYLEVCKEARAGRPVRLVPQLQELRDPIAPRLDAIERLTDGAGMIQHSIYSVPDRNHGYCLDDNARALLLMHAMPQELASRADELARIYASFVQHAWNGEAGRFRNFMGYDRQWLESTGSEDSFGRAVWSIGGSAAKARQPDLRRWALHLFDQVAPNALQLHYPRSWAFALIGADLLLDAHPGHPLASTMVADFGSRLHELLLDCRRPGWGWFEPVLSYDNARLCEALLRAGRRQGSARMTDDGLAAFEWLKQMQRSEAGQFRAIGTEGFGRAFADPLSFDQQPLEAWATIDAADLAFAVSGDERWRAYAWTAFRWYLGDNEVGVPIASLGDGGCFDGLMSDRANLNQGAESVLSFQFACCAIQRIGRMAETGSSIEQKGSASAS